MRPATVKKKPVAVITFFRIFYFEEKTEGVKIVYPKFRHLRPELTES
jgi:hypothetical protein